MQSHVPAGDSRAVLFATTADGLKLPVIDVTHPAFAIPDDPASLAARRDALLAWDRLRKRMIAQARFRLFPRGLEGFAPLAERRLCDRREPHRPS